MSVVTPAQTQVLVTGGAGFIGLVVCAGLVERGYRVRVLDNLRPDVHGDPASSVAKAERYGEIVVGDVTDPTALDRALVGVEAVIHLAAKEGLGVGIADLPDYAWSNDYGTACLLAAMARADVRCLTLASSMVVYGEGLGHCSDHGEVRPAPRPDSWLATGRYEPPCPICGAELAPALVGEDAEPDPRNAYAASKLAQEQLARTWARSTDSQLTVLRNHNVYGPGLPANTQYPTCTYLYGPLFHDRAVSDTLTWLAALLLTIAGWTVIGRARSVGLSPPRTETVRG